MNLFSESSFLYSRIVGEMATNEPPSLQIQIDPPEDESESDGFSYNDIMLIGRTGFGKSTVGNKLLGIDPDTGMPLNEEVVIKQWDIDGDQKCYFEMGEGRNSVTMRCKVLSNEKDKDRVMDTRGFADSEMTQKYGVIQGNLQSFRWILQAQRAYDLRFARVVYFLPKRGPPERADGTLQEEIKVMYSFFGQKIFDIMVIVVTNNKRDSYQRAGFHEEDIAETKEVFMSAFRKVTSNPSQTGETDELRHHDTDKPNTIPLKCLPVVYIPFNETPDVVLKSIVGAEVISDAEVLVFSPQFPLERKSNKKVKGKSLCFEDRCSRCALKLVYERLKSGEELPVGVIFENGDEEVYDNSYCHPYFIPKYSRLVKFVGGIAHIITLGAGKIYEMASKKKSWPGFTNSEEVCVHCRKSPGEPSCHPVNQWIKIGGERIKVDHSRNLDTVKLLEEDVDDSQD